MNLNTIFAVSAERRYSKTNQEMYTTIEFINPDDGKLFKTYISDSNYNSQYWDDLLEHMRLHEDKAVVIEGYFKAKRGNVINADSKFQTIATFDRDTVLNEVWDQFYE